MTPIRHLVICINILLKTHLFELSLHSLSDNDDYDDDVDDDVDVDDVDDDVDVDDVVDDVDDVDDVC